MSKASIPESSYTQKLPYPKAPIPESSYIYEWKIITEKKIDTQKKIS